MFWKLVSVNSNSLSSEGIFKMSFVFLFLSVYYFSKTRVSYLKWTKMSDNRLNSFFYSFCRIKIFGRVFNILLLLIVDSVLSTLILDFSICFEFRIQMIVELRILGDRNLIFSCSCQTLVESSFYDFLFSIIFESFWGFSCLIFNALILRWLWYNRIWMLLIPFLHHLKRLSFMLIMS